MKIHAFSGYLKEALEVSDKDLLQMGIKEEKAAIKLYTDAANKTNNKEVRDLFLHVTKEEEEHMNEFKELLEKLV